MMKILRNLFCLSTLLMYINSVQAQNPSFTSTPVTSVNYGQLYNYVPQVAGTNPITIVATKLPYWLTLKQNWQVSSFPGNTPQFSEAFSITTDASGNIFVADSYTIKKVTPGGVVSLLAGGGSMGHVDGTGKAAYFEGITGLAADATGNIYVADWKSIRKVTSSGKVTTLLYNQFLNLTGIAIDLSNNIYVADRANYRIYKVTQGGTKTIYAGSGVEGSRDGNATSADFSGLNSICVDAQSNVYVTEVGVNRVRKISSSTGLVQTLAGGPGKTTFSDPFGITIDASGNLYVADKGNNRIRKIDYGRNVTTICGSSTAGYADGATTSAQFASPIGIVNDKNGNLYVADYGNSRIRKIVNEYLLTGTPVPSDAGNNSVTLKATNSAGSKEQSFDIQVMDGEPPTATAYSPEINATVDTKVFQLFFSEPIKKGNGSIYIKTSSNNAIVEKINIGSDNVEISNVTIGTNGVNTGYITISPSTALPQSTKLYITIDPTAIEDFAGNKYAGISSKNTWTFQTAARTDLPVFTSTPITTADYGKLYTYPIQFSGKAPLTFNAITLPSWLTLLKNVSTLGGTTTFKNPYSTAVDAYGNVYVADMNNHSIRKISPDGTVNTLAGSGSAGYKNATGTAAQFKQPVGVVVDAASRYLYVVDAGNYRIRKVEISTGKVTTFAGSASRASIDGTGENANFYDPRDICIDASGNLYVSEPFTIRKITPAGVVTSLAGNSIPGFKDGQGKLAEFKDLRGIAVDQSGNIYVTDQPEDSPQISGTIRKITPSGTVTTIRNELYVPSGIVVDASDNIYVAEGGTLISKISKSGLKTTFSGTSGGYIDGSHLVAKFGAIRHITFDAGGNMYVTESGSNRIRKISTQTDPVLVGTPALEDVGDHDVVLNLTNNISTNSQVFKIKVRDGNAPAVVTFSPGNNAIDVLNNTDLVLTFDKDIKKGTGYIYIKRDVIGTVLEKININSSNVLISGKKLTINPDLLFPNYTNLYITVDQGAILSTSGVEYPGFTDNWTCKFKTKDLVKNLLTIAGTEKIELDWDLAEGAAEYSIYRESSGPASLLKVLNAPLSNYIDSTVSNTTTYYYTIVAKDARGEIMATYPQVHATPLLPTDLLNNITFKSSNSNPLIAKVDDDITLSFSAKNTLKQLPQITIAGHPIVPVKTGDNYQAVYKMTIADAEDAVPFSISGIEDINGVEGNDVTEQYLNDDLIFFDKTSPLLVNVKAKFSNPDAGRIKPGDVITIGFDSDETLEETPKLTLFGHELPLENSANHYEVSYTVSAADNQVTSLNLHVTGIKDMAGNTGTDVQIYGPSNLSLSSSEIEENRPVGTIIGIFSSSSPYSNYLVLPPAENQDPSEYLLKKKTDVEVKAKAFMLVEGEGDNEWFRIEDNRLRTEAAFNYEVKQSYSILVRVIDESNVPYEKEFTITVNDLVEMPHDILLSQNLIMENSVIGTKIGVLKSVVDDTEETFIYSLVPVEDNNDYASFSISGDELRTNALIDYEKKNEYNIKVRSTNALQEYYEKIFTIHVLDMNSKRQAYVSEKGDTTQVVWAQENGKQYTFYYELKDENGNVVVPITQVQSLDKKAIIATGVTMLVSLGGNVTKVIEVGAPLAGAAAFAVEAAPLIAAAGGLIYATLHMYEYVSPEGMSGLANSESLFVGELVGNGLGDAFVTSIQLPLRLEFRPPTTPEQPQEPDSSSAHTLTRLATTHSSSSWADIDNDGDLDLVMMFADKLQGLKKKQTQLPRTLKLYLNISSLGMGNKGLVPYPVQIPSFPEIADGSITWLHANSDPYLDLFVTGMDTLGIAYSKLYYQTTSRQITNVIHSTLKQLNSDGSQVVENESLSVPDIPLFFDPSISIGSNSQISETERRSMPTIDIPGLHKGASAAGDLNNDGLQDLVVSGLTSLNVPFAAIYLQHKNNLGFELLQELEGAYGGSISIGDFDRSGRQSILLTGVNNVAKVYSQHTDGTFKEVSLPIAIGGSSKWWDYDNDGFLDIIIAGSPSKILHNEKGKSFVDVTHQVIPFGVPDFEETAIETADFNNDGKPDFVISGIDADSYETKLFYQQSDNKFAEDTQLVLPQVGNGSINFIYDENGVPQLFFTGTETPTPFMIARALEQDLEIKKEPLTSSLLPTLDIVNLTNQGKDIAANTPPVSPVWMASKVNADNSVTLSWQESYDAETPDRGLTYNVYVSSEPGESAITPGDMIQNANGTWDYTDLLDQTFYTGSFNNSGNVMNPMSMIPYGRRNVIQMGNTTKNSYTIKDLEPGKVYYWSVQTIDNGYLSSEFSAERYFYLGDVPELFPEIKTVSVHPALSLNGDGINDKLEIKGIENFPVNKVTIFNVTGQQIWSSANYNNTSTVFPYKNGSQMDISEGTYYYVINYDNDKWLTGYIVVLH